MATKSHCPPVPCETCKRPEDAVNHVPGHIFVGWGMGWQPCPTCGGSGVVGGPSARPSGDGNAACGAPGDG